MEPFSDITTYPEIPTWTLINLYTGAEMIVTDSQLAQAFPVELELMKIKSGRSKAWMLIENHQQINAINELY
ncbi:protein GP45.2 [Acinetobacter baumannii]